MFSTVAMLYVRGSVCIVLRYLFEFFFLFIPICLYLRIVNFRYLELGYFEASIWINNTFWLLSPTLIWHWSLFYKSKLPEVQINLPFGLFELVKKVPTTSRSIGTTRQIQSSRINASGVLCGWICGVSPQFVRRK